MTAGPAYGTATSPPPEPPTRSGPWMGLAAAVLIVAGVLAILLGLLFGMYVLGYALAPPPVGDPSAWFMVVVAGAAVAFGVLQLVAGIGLVRRARWGSVLALAAVLIGFVAGAERIISGFRAIAFGSDAGAVVLPALFGLAYAAVALVVLLNRREPRA